MRKCHSLIVAGMLAATACGPTDGGAGEWHDIAAPGWRYGDSLVFNSAHDSAAVEAVELTVRHTAAYEYANLWVELSYATGDTVHADTFNVRLSDSFGRWYGQGSGVTFQRTDTLTPTRRVNPGSELKVRHIMRVDTLREIEQVGLAY